MTGQTAPISWLSNMKLETIVVGDFAVNCYIYFSEESKSGIIIDPGADPDKIIRKVDSLGIKLMAILLTHGHCDHIGALADIKERYDIPIYIGKGEELLLKDTNENGSALLGQPITAPDADFLFEDETPYSFGDISLRVLYTPGHSRAGVCFLDETEGILFCGDTLFQSSIGRTDLPGGSFKTLIDSIQKKILPLPDGIVCLPGHGPSTTVGAERRNNPFFFESMV